MTTPCPGDALPALVSAVPGPQAQAWVQRLAEVECPAITARRTKRNLAGGRDPIVWAQARGANVVDVDGNRYVDLSAGFAVSGVGHAHPKVVEAAERQLHTLIHGMGDLFPSMPKILLGERLAQLAPGDLQHSILGCNGSDAVEAAIKTAQIATGRRRVLGFHGGYHGMSLGALGVSGYRDAFRAPFAGFAGAQELRLPFANCERCPFGLAQPSCQMACANWVDHLLGDDTSGSEDVAAIIVEPIQGRGGDIVPPAGWLKRLREITEQRGILLIFDEIYTGFGRTGAWFACQHEDVVPDLLCVGKALGGGFPISAAIGRASIMERWGTTQGEGLHTSTFLGNPLGCSMALAALDVIEDEGLVARAASLGRYASDWLNREVAHHPHVVAVRGRGLMLGVALQHPDGTPWAGGGVQAMNDLLEAGIIVSPGGPLGDVISLAPPYVITEAQLEAGLQAIATWMWSRPVAS